MSQKIAFITGGNRGLGFQTALDLKNDGVKVVIGSRDANQGQKALQQLRAAGVDADAIKFDITIIADALAMRKKTMEAAASYSWAAVCLEVDFSQLREGGAS